jgi:hypothetical protein
LDVRRLAKHVVRTLQGELGLSEVLGDDEGGYEAGVEETREPRTLRRSGREIVERWKTISTLDEGLCCPRWRDPDWLYHGDHRGEVHTL